MKHCPKCTSPKTKDSFGRTEFACGSYFHEKKPGQLRFSKECVLLRRVKDWRELALSYSKREDLFVKGENLRQAIQDAERLAELLKEENDEIKG